MSDRNSNLIKHIYERFNARDIEGVLATLSADVAWANGMEGGHVHGHEAVRDYWTRQWAIVSPHVEPVAIRASGDSTYTAEVIQRIFDLQGQPLKGQSHGLKDKTVLHIFTMKGDKIVRFDIGEVIGD